VSTDAPTRSTATSELATSLTVAQAAVLLGVHQKTVRRWIREQKVSVLRVGPSGSLVRIPVSAIEALLTEQAAA
jgi:excisionase family DNA binding protein